MNTPSAEDVQKMANELLEKAKEQAHFHLYVTFGILLIAMLTMCLLTYSLRGKDVSGSHIVRVFGIVLILSFSSILLLVGYNKDQLTPIVGLFGAIAGYLLGRDNSPAQATTERKVE